MNQVIAQKSQTKSVYKCFRVHFGNATIWMPWGSVSGQFCPCNQHIVDGKFKYIFVDCVTLIALGVIDLISD